MSTRSTASRKSQPPLRFPKIERPPVPPAGSSDLPHAAVLLPTGQAAQVIIPPQGKPTLPGSPPPSDEEPQALPDRRLIATPEEVLQAQVRELDHVLREALDRLADADQRITQLEAESTRFRDNVLPVMESRIAAMERLTVTRLVDQDSLAAIRSGVPLSGKVSDTNLPRESVVRNGRRGKGRSGKRDTNNHEMGEHSETSSNTEDDSYSSDEVTHTLGLPIKGKAVPGLKEIIPARSDYTHLVSYRSYRLVNRSNRYDASVTGKLSSYLKRMKHAIPQDDRFSGDEPIEVLSFLRVFKEAADHNELPEAAAARLITYFLVGIAKEGYRAHLDEAPICFPTYPYMVQYLLETYAVDDELSRAYMAVTTAKQAENEGEKSFGRRLHRLAIKAGNVIDKRDLTTIYVEGLLPFVQSGLRMHLNPGMSFETVQRHAHNLGVSLRQTIQQSAQSSSTRVPLGVKVLLPRGNSAPSVNSTETADAEEYLSKGDFPAIAVLEAALASTTTGNNFSTPSGTPSGSNRHPWKPPMPRSPSPSVVSIPTRGWASPVGSVRSEPSARTGITKPVLCFLCYEPGHYLAECPRLPAVLQREATANREAYQRGQRAREATRHENPDTGTFIHQGNKTEVMEMESAVPAMETPIISHHSEVEDDISPNGSENLLGGN
jgi:hypothetical protein